MSQLLITMLSSSLWLYWAMLWSRQSTFLHWVQAPPAKKGFSGPVHERLECETLCDIVALNDEIKSIFEKVGDLE